MYAAPPRVHSSAVSSTPRQSSSGREKDDDQLPIQKELKELMAEELEGATWELDNVMAKICPADQNVLDDVLRALETKSIWPTSPSLLQARPIKDRNGQTIESHGEKSHYQPMIDIFEGIKEAFHVASKNLSPGIYHNHTMLVCNKPTGDKIGNAAALKPDLAVAAGWFERLYWADIQILVEVKDKWADMLKQALTYARAVFVKQDRYYVLCILYNYSTSGVRFCFCTRSGVISSPELSLKSVEGFRLFVEGMVGILSLQDMKAAGVFDQAETLKWLQELTGAMYSRKIRIMIRTAVRGRGTGADLYERVADGSAEMDVASKEEEEEEGEERVTVKSIIFPVAPPSPMRGRMTRLRAREVQKLNEQRRELNMKSGSTVSAKLSGQSEGGSEKVRLLV